MKAIKYVVLFLMLSLTAAARESRVRPVKPSPAPSEAQILALVAIQINNRAPIGAAPFNLDGWQVSFNIQATFFSCDGGPETWQACAPGQSVVTRQWFTVSIVRRTACLVYQGYARFGEHPAGRIVESGILKPR